MAFLYIYIYIYIKNKANNMLSTYPILDDQRNHGKNRLGFFKHKKSF